MAGNSGETGRSVTSKVIAILQVFGRGSVHTLTEMARLSQLPISTVYRLATELTAWGALERTDDGQYRIGERLVLLGRGAISTPRCDAYERSRRIMEDLSVAAGRAEVRLGVLAGSEVVFISKPSGARPVPTTYEPAGQPAHATAMGKALLAFSSANLVDMVIARGLKRYTPFTVTTAEGLRRSLAVIRLTGTAVTRRELSLNTVAVAAPVFGSGGEILAALELQDEPGRDVRTMSPPLIVAARCLSRELLNPAVVTRILPRPPFAVNGHHLDGR